MKIIITENQLKLLKEAVGVPKGIMEAAEQLYDLVSKKLKNIKNKQHQYIDTIYDSPIEFYGLTLENIELTISVDEIPDYYGKTEITSMGVGTNFRFNETIMMQVNLIDKSLDLHINFVVPKNWEINSLYDVFTKDETDTISVLAHELKHRIDKEKKRVTLIGNTAEYNVYASNPPISKVPVMDSFMRYSYYIQNDENLVRPVEVATRMIKNNITKKDFYDFIVKDKVFKELKEIQNFTFEYFMDRLKNEMKEIDFLLKHINIDTTDMDSEKKIQTMLKITYINLVNRKADTFDNYINYNPIENMFKSMFGIKSDVSKKETVRNKFMKHILKYQDREVDFFKDECERFNYIATKMIKKISKIYSLLPDEKETTNESILNWDLYQKLMEKRNGKQKFDTEYKFRR